MPTPFIHLHIAEQIRATAAATQPEGTLHCRLNAHWPAFYLGSVAPDVQTVSGAPRAATHFYNLPPAPDSDAVSRLWTQYPSLAEGAALPPAQGIFVAAYCAHLMLDLIWFREVLIPYFAEVEGLGEFKERRLLHHTLLTYLDRQAYEALPPDAASTLAAARPRHWLPFVADADLAAWQAMLAAQLAPGAPSQTIRIYAERMEMAPDRFAARVADEAWLAQNLFARIPMAQVKRRLETAVGQSIRLITDYLDIDSVEEGL
jgi:hypothetical protein